jgi:hypothetical protein
VSSSFQIRLARSDPFDGPTSSEREAYRSVHNVHKFFEKSLRSGYAPFYQLLKPEALLGTERSAICIVPSWKTPEDEERPQLLPNPIKASALTLDCIRPHM